jgi:hypothetical protein
MKIIVDTDGTYEGTVISFNGEDLLPPKSKVIEFHLSIHPKGKMKLQLTKIDCDTKKGEFISMYGEDFKKYDEKDLYLK